MLLQHYVLQCIIHALSLLAPPGTPLPSAEAYVNHFHSWTPYFLEVWKFLPDSNVLLGRCGVLIIKCMIFSVNISCLFFYMVVIHISIVRNQLQYFNSGCYFPLIIIQNIFLLLQSWFLKCSHSVNNNLIL